MGETSLEEKAFVRLCYSVLVDSDTIEEVISKMDKLKSKGVV